MAFPSVNAPAGADSASDNGTGAPADRVSVLNELETIYRTAPIALCVLDSELRFVRINDRMAELNGVPAADHIGRTAAEVVPNVAAAAEPMLRHVLNTGQALVDVTIVAETAAQPGVMHEYVESWTPLLDDEGRVVGINVIAEDVTERRTSERMREAFAAMLSHELRTPVTTILAAAGLLERRLPDEATAQGLLDDIQVEADRLNRMVEDLLIMSRAQNQSLETNPEPFLLARQLPKAITDVRRRYPALEVGVEIDGAIPVAWADTTLVSQIVSNLLTNTAKYGGGRATIRANASGEFIEVCVDDDGPGVGADEVPRLFDLFYRSPTSVASGSGTGVGLFVVKALVEAIGGSVSAHRRDGRGLSVRFTIPTLDAEA